VKFTPACLSTAFPASSLFAAAAPRKQQKRAKKGTRQLHVLFAF